MDIKAFLILVSNHVDQIFGTTLVLFFITSIILLIRSIGGKNKDDDAPSSLDVRDIEGAMKRVLATQGVSLATPPAGGNPAGAMDASAGGGQPPDVAAVAATAASAAALAQRESKIEELTKSLEQARAEAQKATAAAGDSGAPAQSQEELAALKIKIEELQARLAEYEIIEDDIADLSLFKEENARLKDELANIKSKSPGDAKPAEPAPAAAAKPTPPSEKFELDPNDDVMKEFASAVEVQRAPPPEAAAEVAVAAPAAGGAVENGIGGAPDTDKMLSEVAAFKEPVEGADSTPALEESLDTDKLLAEAGSFAPATPAAPPPQPEPATAPAAAPIPAAPSQAAAVPPAPAAANDGDDLLAEFVDSKTET